MERAARCCDNEIKIQTILTKNIIQQLFPAVLLTLVSCASEMDDAVLSERGLGHLRVQVTADAGALASRAVQALTEADKDRFTLTIQRGTTTVLAPKAVSTLTDDDLTVTAGANYRVSVESCTAEAAEVGYGVPRLAAISDAFTVTAGEESAVALCCLPQNAGVKVAVDESFTTDFGTDYTLTATLGDRVLTFTQAAPTAVGYYNVPAEGATLSYTLQARRLGNGKDVTASGTALLQRGQITQFVLKDVGVGYINIGITYDDTLTPETIDLIIDVEGEGGEGPGTEGGQQTDDNELPADPNDNTTMQFSTHR